MELSIAISGTGAGRRLYTFSEVGAAPDGTEGELHLFVGRKWVDEQGEEFDLSGDAFDQMVRNFKASDSKRLSIDYDHRSWHPTNPDSRAAGWIVDLFTRNGASGFRELWAKVEWTEAAAKQIKSKEWQFCSPTFVLGGSSNKTGNEIGAQLLNVALTNIPFQDGLTPIRLSLAAAKETAMPTDAPASDTPATDDGAGALNAFVDLVAESAGIDRMAAIAMLGDKVEEIGRMLRDAADKDGMPADEGMMSQAAATQLPPAASPETAPAAAAAQQPDEVRLLKTEVRALSLQLKQATNTITTLATDHETRQAKLAEEKRAAIEREADAIIADGRAFDSDRADLVYMLSHDPERAARIFASKRVPIATTQAPASSDPAVSQGAPTSTDGSKTELQFSDLNPRERGIYDACVQMGVQMGRSKSAAQKIALKQIGAKREEFAREADRMKAN